MDTNLSVVDYSQLDSESRAVIARKLEDAFKDRKTETFRSFLQMGQILKEIRDNQLYVELGYDSIIEWFSSPDISVTPNWAWGFISIYETFVLKHKYAPEDLASIDYTKLKDITTLVKEHPEDAEKWVENARNLRRIDLRKEIRAFVLQEREKQADAEVPAEQQGKCCVNLVHGETIAELQKLADESVDLVVTSPPLVVSEDEKRERQHTDNFVFVHNYQEVVDYHKKWLSEVQRALKKDGAVFIMGNLHNIFTLGHVLQELGFLILRDIIWEKPNPSLSHNIFNLIKAHDTIIWARKGSKHTNNLTEVERDIWEINHYSVYEHYSEKPNLLVDKILTMATGKNDLIVDPFVGAGSVAVAAHRLKRNFIGIEADKEWYDIAKARVKTLGS